MGAAECSDGWAQSLYEAISLHATRRAALATKGILIVGLLVLSPQACKQSNAAPNHGTSKRALVPSKHRRAQVLVSRQGHDFEIVVVLARLGYCAEEGHRCRTRDSRSEPTQD
jgi:hypothetical protein